MSPEAFQPKHEASLESAKAAIIPPDKYPEHPLAHDPGLTHIFEAKRGEKSVTYVGCQHASDPRSTVFGTVLNEFERVQPDMVFVEGMEWVNDDRKAARERMESFTEDEIMRRGENGYALRLAMESNIDFESPEPPHSRLLEQLSSLGYSHKDLFLEYFYKIVHQYQRQGRKRTLEACKKDLAAHIEDFRTASGWDEAELDQIEEEAWTALDLSNEEFYKNQADPIPWGNGEYTVSRQIAGAETTLRDEYALERIAEALKIHDRIFIVYGRSHAISLEPAIRKLLSETERS